MDSDHVCTYWWVSCQYTVMDSDHVNTYWWVSCQYTVMDSDHVYVPTGGSVVSIP